MNFHRLAFLPLLFCNLVYGHPLIVAPGEADSNTISIEVLFDGQPRLFQLDTGANDSMVKADATTLMYPVVGHRVSKGAAGKPITCDEIEAAQIEIGALNLKQQRFARCDFGGAPGASFDNLGLVHFEERIIELDFSKAEMEFPESVPEGVMSLPMKRFPKGHIGIPIQIAGNSLYGLFDTGAQISAIDTEFVNANPDRFKALPIHSNVTNITGEKVEAEYYLLDELEIAGKVFKDVSMIAFDFGDMRKYFGADTPLIVGTNIIIQADWILDLKENQWSLREPTVSP